MKRIYFVRHGESEQNIGGITGESSPLTTLGIQQAKFIAHRAAKLPIEAIISSSAVRAQQTAHYVAETTGKSIVDVSDLLIERQHPAHTIGLRQDDPEQLRVEELINVKFGEEGFRIADEETFVELKARAVAAMAYLDARPEQELLVVTHGMFLRMLLGVVIFGPEITNKEGRKLSLNLKLSNTGLTIIERSEDDRMHSGWRVLVWNDHAHLG